MGPGATIGGRSEQHDVPIIGNDVYIATGAKVLGALTVGDGSVIGANAVVISSVPARAVAAGVPARIVKTDIDSSKLTGWPPNNNSSDQ
jgi:serine O-acetyltransferase